MFVDKVKIYIKAGDGGDGAIPLTTCSSGRILAVIR